MCNECHGRSIRRFFVARRTAAVAPFIFFRFCDWNQTPGTNLFDARNVTSKTTLERRQNKFQKSII